MFVCMRVCVGAASVSVASCLSNGAPLCVGGVSSPQLKLIFLVLIGFCQECIVTALWASFWLLSMLALSKNMFKCVCAGVAPALVRARAADGV